MIIGMKDADDEVDDDDDDDDENNGGGALTSQEAIDRRQRIKQKGKGKGPQKKLVFGFLIRRAVADWSWEPQKFAKFIEP